MIPSRLRGSGALCGLLVILGALFAPAPAVADGPGYGETADEVTVQWVAEAGDTAGLALYAVGFGAGSPVVLRVGAAADRTVHADQTGALRVLMVNAADAGDARPATGTAVVPVDADTAGKLSTGFSVAAIGRDPAGGIRTLVGTIPPPATGNGVQDVAPWVVLAVVVLISGLLTRVAWLGRLRDAVGGLTRRLGHRTRPTGQGSKR